MNGAEDGLLARLGADWEQGWERLSGEVEGGRQSLQSQSEFYETEIRNEEKRLGQVYSAIDEETEVELEKRRQHIDATIGSAVKRLNKFLDRKGEGPPDRGYFRQLNELLQDILSRQVPLYELAQPSPSLQSLRTTMATFQQMHSEWIKLAIDANDDQKHQHLEQQHQQPRKRRLVSRIKSKIMGFIGRKAPPAARASAAAAKGAIDDRYRRGLEVRLLALANDMLTLLRELLSEMIDDAQKRIERQRVAKREYAESKTGLTAIKRANSGLHVAFETRDLALHRARMLAGEQKEALEKSVEDAKQKLVQQRQLIDQTLNQQLTSGMAPQPAVPKKKSLGKRNYPQPGSTEFAKELRHMFPQFYLAPTNVAQGSQCVDPAEGQIPPRKPYQELFRKLVTVDSPYRGFLAYHGVGSGKTRLGWETIDQWISDNIESTGSAGSPVLVLLPTNKLIGSWSKEASKFISPLRFTITPYSTTDNTTILELIPNAATFGRSSGSGFVILHKMTVLPDAATARIMHKHLPANQELVETSGYHLQTYPYNSHPAYTELTADEKRLLTKSLDEQKREIQSRVKLVLPSRTLVLIDEAHNLVNPQEIAKSVTASTTTLAWANLLKQAVNIKLLLLTATPLLDDSKLSDLFKLLNLLQLDKTKQTFEGTWRRSLASDEPEPVKEAAIHADELESRYLQSQMFDIDGNWKPGLKQALQEFYAGLISYLTLSSDPTVYPSLQTECQQDPESSCSFLWNSGKRELEPVSVEELNNKYGLPKPKSGTNVLVPMTTTQFKNMQKAMQQDLSRWNQHRRLDADPNQPSAEMLNFAGPVRTTKSSIMASWGTKAYRVGNQTEWPEKAHVLLHLMNDRFPNDKFFTFTSSLAQTFATQMTDFFTKVGNYEVWDILRVARFIHAHPELSQRGQGADVGGQLANGWLANHVPAKRVLIFIGSATALQGMHATTQGLVRDMMLALWNSEKNLNGEFFQGLIGDRTTKEGFNLLYTKHVVFMEPAVNPTMQTQAEARVLRFCALQRFAFETWRNIRLWRLISIPPSSANGQFKKRRKPLARRAAGTASPISVRATIAAALFARRRLGGAKNMSGVGGGKTNEEMHYAYIQNMRPISQQILAALKEIAIDCLLFRDYNQDPDVPLCFGQTPADLSPIQQQQQQQQQNQQQQQMGPRLPRLDRYCTAAQHLLLQDEGSNVLTEFTPVDINPEYVRQSDEFERACKLGKALPALIGPVTYKDLLVHEALAAPLLEGSAAAAVYVRYNIQTETLLIKEVLQLMSTKGGGLGEDLKLWMLVTALPHPHRAPLDQFVIRRLDRKTEEDRRRYTGIVEQIIKWMQFRLAVDLATENLVQFLKRIPTIADLGKPNLAAIPPRYFPTPSAPPLADLSKTAGTFRRPRRNRTR